MFLALTALVFLALKKSSKHENLSSALQITFHFMRKKHLSCTWALLLKLHLATFSHWERSFSASVALHSLHLLSCTKHSISVLRSSKLVILCIEALTWLALQKSSNTWKSVFYIANNIHFMRKKHLSLLELTLKIAFSNFLSLRKKLFSIRGLDSLHLLSCTKHSISVLSSNSIVLSS